MHALSSLAPKAADIAATLEQSIRRLDAYIKVPNGRHACTALSWISGSLTSPACLQAFFMTDAQQLGRWAAMHPEYLPGQHAALAAAVATFKGLRRKDKTAFMTEFDACLSL